MCCPHSSPKPPHLTVPLCSGALRSPSLPLTDTKPVRHLTTENHSEAQMLMLWFPCRDVSAKHLVPSGCSWAAREPGLSPLGIRATQQGRLPHRVEEGWLWDGQVQSHCWDSNISEKKGCKLPMST